MNPVNPQKKYNNIGESNGSTLPKNLKDKAAKKQKMQEEKKRTIRVQKDYQPKPKPAEPKSKEYIKLKEQRDERLKNKKNSLKKNIKYSKISTNLKNKTVK